jgi:hypothetical protein
MKTYVEWKYISAFIGVISVLDGREWLASRFDRFSPGEIVPGALHAGS